MGRAGVQRLIVGSAQRDERGLRPAPAADGQCAARGHRLVARHRRHREHHGTALWNRHGTLRRGTWIVGNIRFVENSCRLAKGPIVPDAAQIAVAARIASDVATPFAVAQFNRLNTTFDVRAHSMLRGILIATRGARLWLVSK